MSDEELNVNVLFLAGLLCVVYVLCLLFVLFVLFAETDLTLNWVRYLVGYLCYSDYIRSIWVGVRVGDGGGTGWRFSNTK